MRSLLACVASFALGAGAVGCSAPRVTEIIVVSDTDMSVPDQLDTIRITVSDASLREQQGVADLAAGAPRPVTLGLLSESGEGTLDVIVSGERGGIEILRRTARVRFQRGRTLAIRLDLWDRCIAELCGLERSCGDAGCRSVEIDPAELSEWTGTPPASPDAAFVRDAAFDGSAPDSGTPDQDADTRDAWFPIDGNGRDVGTERDAFVPPPDAARPDTGTAECTFDIDCDDGLTCTGDVCEGGSCSHVTSDAACDDGVACTTQRCDVALGCVYVPDDAACDDGVSCTTNTCDPLAGCTTAVVHAMCGGGSYCDIAAGCTVAPTFTEIYSTIITPNCGPCHISAGTRGGELDMATQAIAYGELFNVVALCGAGVNTLVIPGDSARSLLWRKISGVDLCGSRMPRMGSALSAAEIDAVARWIEAGAVE